MKIRKKKRRLKLGNIFIAISLICLIGLTIVHYSQIIFQNNDIKNERQKKEKQEEKEIQEEKEEIYEATMITAGDNLIHSSIYKEANRNANYNGYDFKPMYELIKPIVSRYDIAYYNQETILGGSELGLDDYPTFNSPYEVGDAMIDAGFNLVSLATNHTIDSGSKAVLNSREYWSSKEGILAVGSYSSESERNEVKIATANNITYTMLNYTYGNNGIVIPTGKEYLVNVWPTDISINDPKSDKKYQEYKTVVKEDIDRVKDKVDVLMVAMHWGVEYTHEPTEYEKDMAQFLADNGVDIIIGTHPHVVQPVTWIDDTLVIYSLGNFISAQYQNKSTCKNYKCTTGLMTSFKITKTVKGNEKKVKIDNISNELIYTYYSGFKNFKVVPYSSAEIVKSLPSYKTTYETYKQVVQKYDENMYVVPAYE